MASVAQKHVVTAAGRSESPDQSWTMLLFESLSAGVMAVFVGFVTVTVIVGAYVLFVWPLTFWDLANLHLERFAPFVRPILWAVFGAGTVAGYLCFGGAIFRPKAAPASPVRAANKTGAGSKFANASTKSRVT